MKTDSQITENEPLRLAAVTSSALIHINRHDSTDYDLYCKKEFVRDEISFVSDGCIGVVKPEDICEACWSICYENTQKTIIEITSPIQKHSFGSGWFEKNVIVEVNGRKLPKTFVSTERNALKVIKVGLKWTGKYVNDNE